MVTPLLAYFVLCQAKEIQEILLRGLLCKAHPVSGNMLSMGGEPALEGHAEGQASGATSHKYSHCAPRKTSAGLVSMRFRIPACCAHSNS